MKLNKKLLIILTTIMAVFVVTSCAPTEQGLNIGQPYIGGTVGLSTYLIEGMPPPMVHDSGNFEFAVGITLENQGEADIGAGTDNPYLRVRLEGINPEQFGVTDSDINKMFDGTLMGARRNFDGTIFPGEMTVVGFDSLNYQPDIHGNTEFTIRADICYDYETIATAKICIKDDVLEHIQDTSICTLTGEKFPQNTGGPVQVTSVVENPMAENKVQIIFVIEHVGIGEFFGRTRTDGREETCDFGLNNFNKYYVDIEIEPLDDSGMVISCSRLGNSNSGKIKLYQGAPTRISCSIERVRGSSGRIYQDLLNIKLKYRYGQFIETPIIIQDVTN